MKNFGSGHWLGWERGFDVSEGRDFLPFPVGPSSERLPLPSGVFDVGSFQRHFLWNLFPRESLGRLRTDPGRLGMETFLMAWVVLLAQKYARVMAH